MWNGVRFASDLHSMSLVSSDRQRPCVGHVGKPGFQTGRFLVVVVRPASLFADAGLHDFPLALQQFSVR